MIDGPEFKSGGARLGGPLLVNRAPDQLAQALALISVAADDANRAVFNVRGNLMVETLVGGDLVGGDLVGGDLVGDRDSRDPSAGAAPHEISEVERVQELLRAERRRSHRLLWMLIRSAGGRINLTSEVAQSWRAGCAIHQHEDRESGAIVFEAKP